MDNYELLWYNDNSKIAEPLNKTISVFCEIIKPHYIVICTVMFISLLLIV